MGSGGSEGWQWCVRRKRAGAIRVGLGAGRRSRVRGQDDRRNFTSVLGHREGGRDRGEFLRRCAVSGLMGGWQSGQCGQCCAMRGRGVCGASRPRATAGYTTARRHDRSVLSCRCRQDTAASCTARRSGSGARRVVRAAIARIQEAVRRNKERMKALEDLEDSLEKLKNLLDY